MRVAYRHLIRVPWLDPARAGGIAPTARLGHPLATVSATMSAAIGTAAPAFGNFIAAASALPPPDPIPTFGE